MNPVRVNAEFMPKEEIKYLERRLELQEFLENLRFLLEAITPNENLYLEYADDDQRPFDQQESIVLQVLYAKRLHKVVGEFEIRRTQDGYQLFNTTNPDGSVNNSLAVRVQILHAQEPKSEVLLVGAVNYPQENMGSFEDLLLH